MNTYTYSVRASGIGSREKAYQEILFALTASGMRITNIRVVPAGLTSTLIDCVFEGSADEYAILKQKLGV